MRPIYFSILLAFVTLGNARALRILDGPDRDVSQYIYPVEKELQDVFCDSFLSRCLTHCDDAQAVCRGPMDDKFDLSCICSNPTMNLTNTIYYSIPSLQFQINPIPEERINYCVEFVEICDAFCEGDDAPSATCLGDGEELPSSGLLGRCICGDGEDASEIATRLVLNPEGFFETEEDDDLILSEWIQLPEGEEDDVESSNDMYASLISYNNEPLM